MNTAAHPKIEPPIRICGSIGAEIEARGYNERLASYPRTFDGEAMNASLLVLPLYGYVYTRHPRMPSTCTRIHESSSATVCCTATRQAPTTVYLQVRRCSASAASGGWSVSR